VAVNIQLIEKSHAAMEPGVLENFLTNFVTFKGHRLLLGQCLGHAATTGKENAYGIILCEF
jgi:hypothetical protein